MTNSLQLEREAEETRSELSHRLDELRERLTPGQVVDDTLDAVAGEFVQNLKRQAAANPLSLCVVGAGLAWMMLSKNRTATRVGGRAGDRLDRTRATLKTSAQEAGERIGEMAQHASERVADWAAGARDKATDAAGSAAQRVKDVADTARSNLRSSSPNTVEWAASLGESAIAAYDPTTTRAGSIMAAARENRLSLCLIGAGLAWMLLSNSRKASQLGAKAIDRLNQGSETARDKFREAGQQMAEMAGEAGERMTEMTGKAGQQMTEMAQDTSERVRDWAVGARDKVSDAVRSATQPETEQPASSLGERGSSVCDSTKRQAGFVTGAATQNTARVAEEAEQQELTGLAGEKDTHAHEATLVPAAPSAGTTARLAGRAWPLPASIESETSRSTSIRSTRPRRGKSKRPNEFTRGRIRPRRS